MPSARLSFLDGLRGIAIVLMIVNHTSRDWIDTSMGLARYDVVYGSVVHPAAIFLFLVGFCLPISSRRSAPDTVLAGAWKYARRGAVIIGAGLLLNAVVLRDVPVWAGGVLQTIGLGIGLLGALLPAMLHASVRWTLLVAGVAVYLGFAWADPALVPWTAAHPALAQIVFLDFPPWPWLSPAMIGLVLGWIWLDARERGPRSEKRYFAIVAIVGAACLVAYVAWDWLVGFTQPFGFKRDFILNHHWTPRGMTVLLVVAGVAWLLAGTYWLMEVRRVSLPWLVVLGQTALMLYFVHQLIELTVVANALGVRLHSWTAYWLANVALVVACVCLGHAWLAIKRIARARMPRRAPAMS